EGEQSMNTTDLIIMVLVMLLRWLTQDWSLEEAISKGDSIYERITEDKEKILETQDED
ncbi:12832_t:CDS:2, partial [Dentiscutata erythropus]